MSELTLIVEIKAQDGAADKVFDAIQTLAVETRKEAGCLAYRVYTSSDDAQVFLIHEEWESPQALSDHGAMPHIKTFKSAVSGLIDLKAQKYAKL